MFEDRGITSLKDGERVGVGVVLAPDGEWAERVELLLQHKGDPWNWQNHEMLGNVVRIDVRFFLLHRNGVPFANVMIAAWRGVGILGHVWTKPEDRRRGSAAALMGIAMADFTSRGGEALFLGTGFDSPSYHLYTKYGFRAVEENSGKMAYYRTSKETFESRYFAPSHATVEQPAWRHWPSSAALFLGDFPETVRCVSLNLFGRSSIERAFLMMFREEQARQSRGEPGRGVVLVASGTEAVVGFAIWEWHRTWPRTCTIDLFCHPFYWHEAPSLLSSLRLPDADRYLAYADSESTEKQDVLIRAGFVAVGSFARRVRADVLGGSYVDVVELEKSAIEARV